MNLEEESDELKIKPVGAGQEVGRSCICLSFKGKRIILDCGIHPGFGNPECLPYIDSIEQIEETDLILISHFHLDHCGGLPHLLLKTSVKGRCFMTHATKAIYRYILADYIRVSTNPSNHTLYNERDIITSMEKIETIDFHQQIEVNGIKFTAYHAGHVLGAAMFMIEIAGVKILYTGDFSRQEDRHLMSAELPLDKPDILITESTYGTHIHDKREEREARFTSLVQNIVTRGGRCLIPAFALGRAQELMLILDEFWESNPGLHHVPIYYASQLARKCLSVYQTYINAMNSKVRKQMEINRNPFIFKHISNLKSIDHFDDSQPCVVMASPGMMQSGLSRELFENWCTDTRNGVIIAGYCVEGTLAKEVLKSPAQVQTMNGATLPLNCSVDYISFSAHTDYQQTTEFIRSLKPNHVVLVHGEANEMMKLKCALEREYEDDETYNINIKTPRNSENVVFNFRGEKTVKLIGTLAANCSHTPSSDENANLVRGVLVKRNFSYHLMAPHDLSIYTDLSTSELKQRISLRFNNSPSVLDFNLKMVAGSVQTLLFRGDARVMRVLGCIDVTWQPGIVYIEWKTDPINDMYADAVQCVILKCQMEGYPKVGVPNLATLTPNLYRSSVVSTLKDMFGEQSIVSTSVDDDPSKLQLCIDNKIVDIDCRNQNATCPEDKQLEFLISGAIHRLHNCLMPLQN